MGMMQGWFNLLEQAPPVGAWDYAKNALAVEERRQAQCLAQVDARQVKCIAPPVPESARTALQLELFRTNPKDYDVVEKMLAKLPRQRQREYFRKLYLQTYKGVKDDGSIAFQLGNLQRRAANVFLREVLDKRLKNVLAAYAVNVGFLQAFKGDFPNWYQNLEMEIRVELLKPEEGVTPLDLGLLANRYALYSKKEKQKASLPFYLIGAKKLEQLAGDLAVVFEQEEIEFMYKLAPRATALGEVGVKGEFLKLYEKCGAICEKIGFDIPYWGKKRCRLKGGQLDTALRKIACRQYWLKTMQKIQKRMAEHVAIACGEVRKQASCYISFNGFKHWESQQKANFEYLKAMILQNVDEPEEQVELLDAYLGSSSYLPIRRLEIMNRARGIEEWAEREGQEALFLTLTAPSAFHATLSRGEFNPKWSGANPRETQKYLNRVWGQFRAMLAKRKIPFYGLRTAEPHHDGTPHWHMLCYVKAEHKAEFVHLFKLKALELDGTEQGAAKYRCKVEECDKSKGSATAYIAKYIAKNIDGFASENEFSDENPNLSLKDNAKRVRAWASLWGIRQFQFFGGGTIGVWRELRRMVAGQCDDEIIEKARACADVSCYASYLDVMGGAMASRKEQPIKLCYLTSEANKYGENRKKIQGLKNQFSLKEVITRLKKWTLIKKRTQGKQRSENEKNSVRSTPWTCVSNCNRSEIVQRVQSAVAPYCLPLNDRQIDWILSGKALRLNLRNQIQLVGDEIFITNPLKKCAVN